MEYFGYIYETVIRQGTFDFGAVKIYERGYDGFHEPRFYNLHPDIKYETEKLLQRQEFEITHKYPLLSEGVMSAIPIEKYAIPLIKFRRIK